MFWDYQYYFRKLGKIYEPAFPGCDSFFYLKGIITSKATSTVFTIAKQIKTISIFNFLFIHIIIYLISSIFNLRRILEIKLIKQGWAI